ncbi:MAG: hypothetical protein HOP11_12315, partial [Saprospiraceae bacterium]|nr:hypothetical protein [Saprospiraceae bacterium]
NFILIDVSKRPLFVFPNTSYILYDRNKGINYLINNNKSLYTEHKLDSTEIGLNNDEIINNFENGKEILTKDKVQLLEIEYIKKDIYGEDYKITDHFLEINLLNVDYNMGSLKIPFIEIRKLNNKFYLRIQRKTIHSDGNELTIEKIEFKEVTIEDKNYFKSYITGKKLTNDSYFIREFKNG